MVKPEKLKDEGDRYMCGNCAGAGISKRHHAGKDEDGEDVFKYEYPCTDCALAVIANVLKK